jgi:hypothetical protein
MCILMEDTNDVPLRGLQNSSSRDDGKISHGMLGNTRDVSMTQSQFKYFRFGPAQTSSINPKSNVSIIDHETNTNIALTETTTSDHYKLLGVNIAFDGNSSAQSSMFRQKGEKLAIAFNRCQLTANDTLQGYQSIFLPGVKYGMAASCIPTSDLKKLQQIITRPILPKLGYNRHFPSSIVYTTIHFGGIGLQDLPIEQGISHTTFGIGHLRANTEIATSLYILLESYMLNAGMILSPLQDNTLYSYVYAPWLNTLRSFLLLTDSRIATPLLSCPALLRLNDQPIMKVASKLDLNAIQLEKVNACRIWLQVTSVAEITDIDGKELLPYAVKGTSNTDDSPMLWVISPSKFRWPTHSKPTNSAWRLWGKVLQSKTHGATLNTSELKTPLGKWHKLPVHYRTWLFHTNKSRLKIRQQLPDGQTRIFAIKRNSTHTTQTYHRIQEMFDRDGGFNPITPIQIRAKSLDVRRQNITRRDFTPTIYPNTSSETTTPPPRPHTPSAPSTRSFIICVRTIHTYEMQTFTWTISQTPGYTTTTGSAQQIDSRSCAPFRGSLIGLFQALVALLRTVRTINDNPKSFHIIICAKDARLLHTIQHCKHKYILARHMTASETELILEIKPLLRRFHHFRTHLITKHEPAHSPPHRTLVDCMEQIKSHNPSIPASYRVKGPATLWIKKQEITSNLETELRHAA